MAYRLWISRFASLAACLTLAGGLAGCSSANVITFTNVSDTWIDVRIFIAKNPNSQLLVSKRKFQIKPGVTTEFNVGRSANRRGQSPLVHMQVQPVTPSWDPPSKQYWMELLTDGPVKIVTSGEGGKLEFDTGDGEVAHIPGKQLKRRFDYRVAGAPTITPHKK